jgi:hypothetical protein
MADPDYFTIEEFRTLPDMGNAVDYTEEKIESAAAYFTAIVERETGMSFSAHSFTTTLDGAYGGVQLPHTSVQSITALTINGTAVSPSSVSVDAGGRVRFIGGGYWDTGIANVTVTYVAGFPECPADIKEPVMWATRDRLLSQNDQAGIDIRRTSVTTEFGTTSYVLPGEKRPTGFPDLDAAIAGRRRGAPFLGML